jgi:hypothetical protein
MKAHIIQAGTENGDRDVLADAVKRNRKYYWIVPKTAQIGDVVIIYLGDAFAATACIASTPVKANPKYWPNRYRAKIGEVALLPRIPIVEIRQKMSTLGWAIYPRSVHTLSEKHTNQVHKLIERTLASSIPMEN